MRVNMRLLLRLLKNICHLQLDWRSGVNLLITICAKFQIPSQAGNDRGSGNILTFKFAVIALFIGIFTIDTIWAQGIGLNSGSSGTQDTLQSFGEFAAVFINIFTFLSLLVLRLAGDLIGTDFITGDEAWNTLLPMWRYVRNLTNIGFVLMLVYLAFTNMIGSLAGDSKPSWAWDIKSKLGPIIFAIIAINFSALLFRVAIDAVHMGSVAIFSIADDQLEAHSANSTFRVLNESKWRRVQIHPDDIASTYLEDGSTPMYIEDVRGAATYDEKIEDKSCSDLITNEKNSPSISGLTYEPNANNLQLQGSNEVRFWWTSARAYDEADKRYIPDPNTVLICSSFAEQINAQFCPDGKDDGQCFFRFKTENYGINEMIQPKNPTAQNLFMAFGTVFMRIEQLPSLAANIDNIFQVIDNTLFSAILSVAYVIALVALLIVLIVRVLILWLAIVFSPALLAATIMGIGGGGGDIASKLTTYLLVPIKIAAAFAISFVMLAGMIEFRPAGSMGMFEFGPALSGLAVDEYAIMWQIATIVIFWMAAKWALKDTYESSIVDGIFKGAETVGGYLAKSATIENQMFTIRQKGGDGNTYDVTLAGMLKAPKEVFKRKMDALDDESYRYYQSFSPRVHYEIDSFRRKMVNSANDYAKGLDNMFQSLKVEGVSQKSDLVYDAIKQKISNVKNEADRTQIERAVKRYEESIKKGALNAGTMVALLETISPESKGEFKAENYTSSGNDNGDGANTNTANITVTNSSGSNVEIKNETIVKATDKESTKEDRGKALDNILVQAGATPTDQQRPAVSNLFEEVFVNGDTSKTPYEMFEQIRSKEGIPVATKNLFRELLIQKSDLTNLTEAQRTEMKKVMKEENRTQEIDS